MKTRLSICIPNYNRPDFLLKNLDELGKQASESIEVVVSDDCSPENVDHVIKIIKKQHPKLKLVYKRQKKNLGFDLNVLEVVRMASGQYCWLLSNDDVVMPNALNTVLKFLDSKKDIRLLLVNYQRFDKVLNQVTAEQMIGIKDDLLFDDKDKFWFYKTKNSYFKSLGVNTLTMSCNIFNRDQWIKSSEKISAYIGHNFIHVFVIATLIGDGQIGYIGKPQVSYLSNNHRTWPNDIWKDYNQVLLGYMREIGFNKKEIDVLQKIQREYEQREALTKNLFLMTIYRLILKTLSFLRRLVK